MYMSELYSALVEQEADTLADDRRRRQMTRPAAAPSLKDIEQDAHIRLIELENRRLKGAFSSLVQTLMDKGLVSEQDIRAVIQDGQQANC